MCDHQSLSFASDWHLDDNDIWVAEYDRDSMFLKIMCLDCGELTRRPITWSVRASFRVKA